MDELDALRITLTEFARQIDVPPHRISQIVAGKRSITGDTALRLGHWFGIDQEFWLNLQAQHDLALADRQTGEVIRHLPTKDSLPARARPQHDLIPPRLANFTPPVRGFPATPQASGSAVDCAAPREFPSPVSRSDRSVPARH